ncbi:uncharacterized protein PAC_01317 [Phialocephala subalpina]|uniref:Glucose-methanol-choline oxidoreductase N-terminal domain-containing protein n=1 Tax=Phialocephala subalpina TaxID=576137 RepID=A0A1L7WF84_9HELO|nr:uncharacterized protein PAC_01317 [Phialocephala subalpina]
MPATNGHTNGHTNGTNGHGGNTLCSIDEFTSQKYDFLVIGGGIAGCCIAARLTEDPSITVGVLEAGKSFLDDPNVSTPSLYPTLIGRKEYDWCMTSTLQPNAGGKVYSMPRGKGLGGSSAINYLMYVRGSRNDYEGWAEVCGDKSWGWKGLAPYFRKHQTLDKTELKSKDPQFHPHGELEKYHGSNGPIHTSFNDYIDFASLLEYMPLEVDFAEAAYEVSGTKRTIKDAWSGDHLGFYSSLGAVDRSKDRGRRSYAATGYIRPNARRPNLKVLTEAHAIKILLENKTAKGVEFIHGGQKYQVPASREIVLSAGVIQTPQILELSGIGDPEVLQKAGIPCIIENKEVSANFQDHILGGLLYDLKPGIDSMDALRGDEFLKAQQDAYEKDQSGVYASPGMMMGFVSYASVATPQEIKNTVAAIKKNSLAKTDFEKAQEKVIVSQDPWRITKNTVPSQSVANQGTRSSQRATPTPANAPMPNRQSKQLRRAPNKPTDNTAHVPPKTRKRQARVQEQRTSDAIEDEVLQPKHHSTRQRKVYEKERASRRLAREPPQFGMFAEQSVAPPLHEPLVRNPLNASQPNSSSLRNRAPPKKSIAAKGAKPRGISKSGREGTNRPKRSKNQSED